MKYENCTDHSSQTISLIFTFLKKKKEFSLHHLEPDFHFPPHFKFQHLFAQILIKL